MSGVIWAQILQVFTENDFKMILISNTRYLGEKDFINSTYLNCVNVLSKCCPNKLCWISLFKTPFVVGEMAQQLRTIFVPIKDAGYMQSTNTGWHMNSCNSSFRGC